MYDFFKGTITSKKPTELVLEVQGVGFQFLISLATFSGLPQEGERVQVFAHLHVREDIQQLFGFLTQEERELFRLLLSVSGIGPKLALTVLSGIGTERLKEAIADNDVGTLTKISGIGRKTAERMNIELREKITTRVKQSGPRKPEDAVYGVVADDSLAALIALGFKRPEAQKAVDKVLDKNPKYDVEQVIREALGHVR